MRIRHLLALLLLAAPAAWLATSSPAPSALAAPGRGSQAAPGDPPADPVQEAAVEPASGPTPAPTGAGDAVAPPTVPGGAARAPSSDAPAAGPAPTAAQGGAAEEPVPDWSRAAPDPAALRAILHKAPGKPLIAALIVDLDSGQTVLDLGGDSPITPASVSKMFPTAAILRTLPADTRLETRLLMSPKLKGAGGAGRVQTLALQGGGDPTLQVEDFDRLARAVTRAGVRQVDQLLVDSTLFDDALPRGFEEKDTDAAYRAPIDALQVRTSIVGVTVRPGTRVGAPVTVILRPETPAVTVRIEAITAKGRADRLQVRSTGKGRLTDVVVTGTLGAGRKRGVTVQRRVHNARTFAGLTFAARLEAAGITVGKTSFGPVGTQKLTLLASHSSRPLLEIVDFTNKTSHNGYAETLFKLVGAARLGAPGTGPKAEQAVQQALGDAGIDWSRTRLGNGSGLYHANRFPAASVVALLRAMYADARVGAVWRSTLAVAGRAGTLRGRMGGEATRGRVVGKTGTLDDVTALAGYALGPARRYAFALFFNRVKGKPGPMRRVHDRLLTALMDPTGATAKASAKPSKPAQRPSAKRPSSGTKDSKRKKISRKKGRQRAATGSARRGRTQARKR